MTKLLVKTRVQISGIVEGDPPVLSYYKIAARPDGKRKLFGQSAKVMDDVLLARLRQEAQSGMEAEVVVEQSVTPVGISNVLQDFTLTDSLPQPSTLSKAS